MVLALRAGAAVLHSGSASSRHNRYNDDDECCNVARIDQATLAQQHYHAHIQVRVSPRVFHRGGKSSLCKIFTGFILCFVVPFLLCFLYVVFYVVPTLEEAKAAAVASDMSYISSNRAGVEWHNDQFIDRGAAYGGKRPVLPSDLRLDKLQCQGLTHEQSQEMVYWQRIDSDLHYTSPYYKTNNNDHTQYLTFMPDGGGFNNIRMSLETVFALAHATGRTLVLPPSHEMYLLYDDQNNKQTQKHYFDFADFFPLENMAKQQKGLHLISMQDFLEREGLNGNLRDKQTGQVLWPPHHNRTDWNGDTDAQASELWPYLEQVSYMPDWNPDECVIAFAETTDAAAAAKLQSHFQDQLYHGAIPPSQSFVDHPTRVYGDTMDRLAEVLNERRHLCLYQHRVTHEPFLHLHDRVKWGGRMLVPFYSYVFQVDWRRDLWTKRFIRDHVRYTDELQCAAARIVASVRARVRQRQTGSNSNGLYSAFHVRRGEFQYKKTRVSAAELYNVSRPEIPEGSTVYVATDESDKSFFCDLAEHYDLVYLDDFAHLLEGINTNYYGMIDQLVASKAEIFFGCWFSTFSGYINRIRGYHTDRLKLPGFERGLIHSYYYGPLEHKMSMRQYWPISGAVYSREFPMSWRNIDQGIDELWEGSAAINLE